ncbi:glycerophosphodiester phosphodiesterase [Actinomadura sp. ATCC 31491]|uniref:Glycerophosphodiester phosphodiesterase n=1 Tax=Actinomadura luzonensis TaxID=2805427 RepID=A0ABT0G2V7_9ACTN|nr:glycerophosphodiester phosphodiesterase family protein [Actinomadura luzonensis]MCK2218834.1 glycerophosphodiester phosphodiesterase [Actinomadura luzonensis]
MYRLCGVAAGAAWTALLAGAVQAALLAGTALAAPAERPRADNIAHRGGSGGAPENTIAACARARAAGADLCEFDVQQTKDQQLVLIHDETLARTTDAEQVFPGRAPWQVADFTLAEIRRLDAGSWFSPRFGNEGVPTLRQALELLGAGGAGLLLEIKHSPRSPGIDRRVAAELQDNRALWQGRRLSLQAFDWQAMRLLHRMVPGVPILLLGTSGARLPADTGYASALVLPHAGLTERQVRGAHGRGLRVYAGTTDRPRVLRRLVSYGVDGIMTDRPARLRGILAR